MPERNKVTSSHDIYAVAILKSVVVVGHIPPKISSTCSSKSEFIMLVNIPYILLNHENHEFFYHAPPPPPPLYGYSNERKKEGVCMCVCVTTAPSAAEISDEHYLYYNIKQFPNLFVLNVR